MVVVDCYTPLQPHRVTPLSGSTGGLCWGAKGRGHLGFEAGASRQVDPGPICFSSCSGCITSCMCACERESVCMKKRPAGAAVGGNPFAVISLLSPRQHGIKRTQSRTVRFSRARRNFYPLWICFVLTNPGRNLICADRIPARGGFVLSSPCPIRGDSATSHQSAINQQSQRFPFSIPLPSGPDCRQSALPRYFATSKAR